MNGVLRGPEGLADQDGHSAGDHFTLPLARAIVRCRALNQPRSEPRSAEVSGVPTMINGKRVAVVMPAYNAEKTLEKTVQELSDVVDIKILVDDSSKDQTAALSRKLGVQTFLHDANYGYGRNQQTCYREALAAGADIVVMVHPDYQYTPLLVPAMAGMIASGVYDMVLASRILGAGALKGGMPFYKYVANRLLTAFQNLFLGVKLSEYHTGFRAFSKELLETLPLLENSDDFVFDNQMIAQAVMFGFQIGEISCPTRYFEEASSINFRRSVKYGLGVVSTTAAFVAHRMGWIHAPIFNQSGRKVVLPHDFGTAPVSDLPIKHDIKGEQ